MNNIEIVQEVFVVLTRYKKLLEEQKRNKSNVEEIKTIEEEQENIDKLMDKLQIELNNSFLEEEQENRHR